MPFKRPGSSRWQIKRRNLPGFGNIGVIATGVTSRKVAERMEALLDDLAERALVETSYRQVIEAVLDRRVKLSDLLLAHNRGDLDALRTKLTDPPLADACARYVEMGKAGTPRRQRAYAVGLLQALLPARARVSVLRDARAVERLLYAAERGEPADPDGTLHPRKRNSVRRYLHRAISIVLQTEYGKAERDRVLTSVRFPAEDDTREVALSPTDVRRLLDASDALHREHPRSGYDEMRVAVRLMLQTSADRGTIFSGSPAGGRGLLVEHVRIRQTGRAESGAPVYAGAVHIVDTKTATRSRTVPVPDSLCRELVPLIEGKEPGDPVFALGYAQVDHRWQKVRARAELGGLRIKDLRAQTAIYAERAGLPLTVAQLVLGHADASMTRRYQKHQAAMTDGQAAEIEAAMGLGDGPDLAGPVGDGSPDVPPTVYRNRSTPRRKATPVRGPISDAAPPDA